MRCTGWLGSSRGHVFTLPRCRRLLLWGRKPRCPCRGAENFLWDWVPEGKEVRPGVSLVGSAAWPQLPELEERARDTRLKPCGLQGLHLLTGEEGKVCPGAVSQGQRQHQAFLTHRLPASAGLAWLGSERAGPHWG